MKKLFKILTVIFFASILMCVVANAHAEEVENEEVVESIPTEEVIEEEQPEVETPTVDEVVDTTVDETVEEEVTASDMIKEFIDEWLIVIFSTIGGFTGSAIIMLIGKGVIEKILENLRKSVEANSEGNENLKEAKTAVIDGLEKIQEGVSEFEKRMETKIADTTDNINNCVKEINYLKNQNSKYQELVALLVTSTPQLASNGYATKILELLNEGSESNE